MPFSSRFPRRASTSCAFALALSFSAAPACRRASPVRAELSAVPEDARAVAPIEPDFRALSCSDPLLGRVAAVRRAYDLARAPEEPALAHPVARAYAALLSAEQGQIDKARALFEQLPEPVRWAAHYPASRDEAKLTEALIRSIGLAAVLAWPDCPGPAAESYLVSCRLFVRHPREAARAFAPVFESSADAAWTTKRRCRDELLDEQLGPAAAPLTQAIEQLRRSLEAVEPGPPQGTMWPSVERAALERIDDLLLAPEAAETGVDVDAELGLEAHRARPNITALPEKLRHFAQASEKASPLIADATCRIAAARGLALNPEYCRSLARAAPKRALTAWLSYEPDVERRTQASFDARGSWGVSGQSLAAHEAVTK